MVPLSVLISAVLWPLQFAPLMTRSSGEGWKMATGTLEVWKVSGELPPSDVVPPSLGEPAPSVVVEAASLAAPSPPSAEPPELLQPKAKAKGRAQAPISAKWERRVVSIREPPGWVCTQSDATQARY